MRRFKSSAHGPINHLFRPRRYRMSADEYCAARARAFDIWQQGPYAQKSA